MVGYARSVVGARIVGELVENARAAEASGFLAWPKIVTNTVCPRWGTPPRQYVNVGCVIRALGYGQKRHSCRWISHERLHRPARCCAELSSSDGLSYLGSPDPDLGKQKQPPAAILRHHTRFSLHYAWSRCFGPERMVCVQSKTKTRTRLTCLVGKGLEDRSSFTRCCQSACGFDPLRTSMDY
jgi:hypothetical protein